MRWTLAALCFLVGCYAPSYGDCQVACAGGACPAGLTCDPGLGVCRIAGAGAAPCPAATDDAAGDGAAGDGAVTDATGDGQQSTFCTQQPATTTFCQDFDRQPLAQQGWDSMPTAGMGTLMLVSSTRSLPNALESRTLMNVDGTLEQARVAESIPVPAVFQSVTVAFDMNIAQRANALSPKGAFALVAGTSFVFDIVSPDAQNLYSILNNSPATQHVFANPFGVWRRFEIRIARAGNQISITLFVEGVDVGPTLFAPAPPAGVSFEIHLGAAGTTTNGECRFDYDSVVVTVT